MRYICTLCNYIHESKTARPSASSNSLDELPEAWVCPSCSAEKAFFQPCNCVKYDSICEKTKFLSSSTFTTAA